MEIRATLDSSCSAEVMRSWVNDLGLYPQWLSIVPRAEVVSAEGEARAWAVELRAKVGPLARSKKLRMESVADTSTHVRFERRETDDRDHSSWVLDAEIEPVDSGCRLTMLLQYGGTFGGGLVERLLRDEIESSKQKLRALVESASPTPYRDPMTTIDASAAADPDLSAAHVAWDLEPLVGGSGVEGINRLLEAAAECTARLEQFRGRVAELNAAELAEAMHELETLEDALGRAGSYVGLRFATDTSDPERGAAMQRFQEQATALETRIIFLELEWAEVPELRATELLEAPELEFCRYYLESARRYRSHLLTEPEEKILTEKHVTGSSAWSRLFDEQTSVITVELPDGPTSLEQGLSRLGSPDRNERRIAAEAVTVALEPGLRTRAYIFNTLMADKATDDRLRSYDSWIASRNLSNQASDASVQALVDSVVDRYDIPQRWYKLKAQLLGVDKIADYDRNASIAEAEEEFTWSQATEIVLDSYGSFSGELADVVRRFIDENWIDAPVRAGKRPGAFCSYTVPSAHPFLLLNWTSRRRDVLTLAHELGHGLHAYLARQQGIFHQTTPLTLAETASVFGETVTFGRLLAETTDPSARLALLAESLEGQIATVFRQVAMNRFENAVHTHRRSIGELSTDDFADAWEDTQRAMLGDAVELTPGYRNWWSYIPHFIGSPGYVYAYAYGQLLALAVYARYESQGDAFVPAYLELLRAGGSRSPEDLGRIVGVDLADPRFWDGGLAIIDAQLSAAEQAARDAGRL